jgi:hypothetical protein
MTSSPQDIHLHDQTRERVPKQDARQGVTLGHVRYVLGISLGLCVIAGVVFAIFVLMH